MIRKHIGERATPDKRNAETVDGPQRADYYRFSICISGARRHDGLPSGDAGASLLRR
jgi:hypothetical protein